MCSAAMPCQVGGGEAGGGGGGYWGDVGLKFTAYG